MISEKSRPGVEGFAGPAIPATAVHQGHRCRRDLPHGIEEIDSLFGIDRPGKIDTPRRDRYGVSRRHPFTAPVSMPLVKCFCRNGYTAAIGISETTKVAI